MIVECFIWIIRGFAAIVGTERSEATFEGHNRYRSGFEVTTDVHCKTSVVIFSWIFLSGELGNDGN